MFEIKKMVSVAWDGLDDMLPALKQAVSTQSDADMLKAAYGPRPQLLLIGIGLGCLLVGTLFAHFGPGIPFKDYVSWPAVCLGLCMALILRRFLFSQSHRGENRNASEFTLLAASLIPAITIVLLGIAAFGDAGNTLAYGHEPQTLAGKIALLVTGLVAVAAALTIAVASLSYNRSWSKALFDLAVRLLVFRITIWVTTLVIIEIGWIGTMVGWIVGAIFSIQIPEWIPELIDELSYALILLLAFLAVIGGTWTACRDSYAELLAKGHVDILKRLEQMLKGEKKKAKKDAKNKASNKKDPSSEEET